MQMGFYASLPLLAGTVGDLPGGWISDLVLAPGNVKLVAARGGDLGFLVADRDRARHARVDPQTCVWYTCVGRFRPGSHGGRFLGDSARYRRRLRGFGLRRHEYVR